MRICLDSGHSDQGRPGAVYPGLRPGPWDDIHERDLNLLVADEIAHSLEEMGHEVLWAPTLTPGARARFANQERCDLLVSIHHNAAANPKARGLEIVYDDRSRISKRFAETVLEYFRQAETGMPVRKVLADSETPRAHLGILEAAKMPAILIEVGFITNAQDRDWILDHLAAEVIAEGIDRFGRQI